MIEDTLDPRLARTLRVYADGGIRPIDALAIATASTGPVRGRSLWSRGSFLGKAAQAGLLLALIGLLIVSVLLAVVGSQRRLPAPFGPAANGLIACSNDGDVLLGDPTTGDTRKILSGPEVDSAPFWSLDGTRIISLRTIGNGMELVRTDAQGQHPVVLKGGPYVDPVFASWSPTGETFAIASMVDGLPRLWLVNTDGTGATMVAPDLQVELFAFRPPDGREILIRGQDQHGIGLYVVDAEGGHRRTLVSPVYPNTRYWDLAEPRYSPDGSQIAYQHHSESEGVTRLHVIDADDPTNDRVLQLGGATFMGWPVWSPDGTNS